LGCNPDGVLKIFKTPPPPPGGGPKKFKKFFKFFKFFLKNPSSPSGAKGRGEALTLWRHRRQGGGEIFKKMNSILIV